MRIVNLSLEEVRKNRASKHNKIYNRFCMLKKDECMIFEDAEFGRKQAKAIEVLCRHREDSFKPKTRRINESELGIWKVGK
jgi:hypothetical protein